MPPTRPSATAKEVKDDQRFRILCVGRAGTGKSSIINRILEIKGEGAAIVEDWKVGKANIEKEFASNTNHFCVLHDSEGFEPGDNHTYDVVSKFIGARSGTDCTAQKKLDAVWLCLETPRAGGRNYEKGDEKLLQLAHETKTPVVIILTKYDLLIRSKKEELKEDNNNVAPPDLEEQSRREVDRALNRCVESLQKMIRRIKLEQLVIIPYQEVSTHPEYRTGIMEIKTITRELVSGKLGPNTRHL